ncbi:MAG: FecR domain-containing protein [Xanthobacteraceae bacterium]
MTKFRRLTPGLLIAGLVAMHSAVSWAEDRIGVAATAKPNADGVTAGNSQTLAAGSEVYANETIRTGNIGQADLVFVDKTNLTVGPTSEVLLDKFVYDPTGAKSSVVFQATRGAFRFVTGTQDHRAYAVNTPYGSLGVRGTVVEVVTQPKGFCEAAQRRGRTPPGCDCATKVRLVKGRAHFRTNAGRVAELTDPNQTVCISPKGDISYGSSSTSILGFELAQNTFSPDTGAPTSPGTGTPTQPTCATPNQTNCTPP